MNNSLSTFIKKHARKFGTFCNKNSAEICTGAAVITSLAGFGMAIKATKDIQPEMEHHKENINLIKEHKTETTYLHDELVDKEKMEIETYELTGEEANKQYRKDLTKEYGRVCLTVAKRYAIPVALEITSVGTMITSNKISRKKNASLAAALTSVQAMYDKYRQNVIDAVGEDKERDIRLGLGKDKIQTQDENGKKKKEEVVTADEEKNAEQFSAWFDDSSEYYHKSHGVNKDFVDMTRRHLTDKLCIDGYLFVNDVLKAYGLLEKYGTEEGQYYGWIYDEGGEMGYQNWVNIEIIEALNPNKVDKDVNPKDFFLVLHPDGYIADKVWPKNIKDIILKRR